MNHMILGAKGKIYMGEKRSVYEWVALPLSFLRLTQ